MFGTYQQAVFNRRLQNHQERFFMSQIFLRNIFGSATNSSCSLFTAFLILAAIGHAFPCSMAVAQSEQQRKQPNIIWIVADDLGYNDLSCMGQKNFSTPNIDRMAAEGMTFTQFYAGCTVCAPSRACFMTGLHTGHVYQRFNGPIQFREDPLDPTIGSFLKSAGYETAMIGKSGLSCNSDDGELPNRKGFDYFFGFTSHREAHRYYPKHLWKNGEQLEYRNEGFEGETYSGDEMLRESLDWIQANRGRPFFLHMSLQQPHADSAVPKKYRDMFLGKFGEEKPYPEGQHYRPETAPKATVAGMITYLDESVGKVIAKVKELGIEDNTIVMFTSDNGPHQEGGHHYDNFDSNGPFRGGKRDMYEGGIRVPLIAWGPGNVVAGKTSDHISAFWDLPATACELAGIEMPVEHDGISFVPTLKGQQQKKHLYLYWEFYEQGGKQAIRHDNWKGIRLNVGADRNAPIALYNLENDPGESVNVADQFPKVAYLLERYIEDAHTPSEVVSFGEKKKKLNPVQRIEGGATLDRETWQVVEVDSESTHNGRLIGNILDDDISTIWHTQWQGGAPSHPHSFVIDLGVAKSISGVRLINRNEGDNGMVGDFDVYISDTAEFDSPVHSGTFEKTRDEQRSEFEAPSTGRFVKFVAKSSLNGKEFTSIAEFNLETPAKR
jgi:arylsulfatase A-like enzyme